MSKDKTLKYIKKQMNEAKKWEKMAWKEPSGIGTSFYQGQRIGLLKVYNFIKYFK